jgi:hypothetical protein
MNSSSAAFRISFGEAPSVWYLIMIISSNWNIILFELSLLESASPGRSDCRVAGCSWLGRFWLDAMLVVSCLGAWRLAAWRVSTRPRMVVVLYGVWCVV